MDDVAAEVAQFRARGVQIQDLPELGTVDGIADVGFPSPPGSPTPTTTRSAQLHHPWRLGDAVRDATSAIYHALRGGTWIPGQQRRMRQLAPGTWNQALAGVLGASPAGKTTATATPSSRSQSAPTSSGSPHAVSGRAAPATTPRSDTPAWLGRFQLDPRTA